MASTNDNNTPIRDRKIGLPDPQGNGGQVNSSVAITGPSKMVQEAAAQNYALKSGTPIRDRKVGLADGQSATPAVTPQVATPPAAPLGTSQNMVAGRFETPPTLQTDFSGVPASSGAFTPAGSWDGQNYVSPMAQTPEENKTNFEQMERRPMPDGWDEKGNPIYNNSDRPPYLNAPYDPKYKSLSDALNNGNATTPEQANFHADPSKKDGGFFSWLKGLVPKKRNGMRPDETEDEYDARMTRNKQMVATFADAIRQIGNIVNTNKGAPVQQFNDPNAALESAYEKRKAGRMKKAAADADAAYKQANMALKERAAEADRNYKQFTLNLKQQAAERQRDKDKLDADHWDKNYQRLLDNDEFNHKMADKKFGETQRHNRVTESQGAARIALSQERNGLARARLSYSIASGGSGGKGVSLANLSSPSGHLNRKKDLSTIEKKQITQYLLGNGYINKKNLDAWNNYVSMGDTKNANDLKDFWIAHAANMPGKKGDTFRQMLKDHYMYGETPTVNLPKKEAKPAATQQQKPQQANAPSKPTKGKGKTKDYKNTKALGL